MKTYSIDDKRFVPSVYRDCGNYGTMEMDMDTTNTILTLNLMVVNVDHLSHTERMSFVAVFPWRAMKFSLQIADTFSIGTSTMSCCFPGTWLVFRAISYPIALRWTAKYMQILCKDLPISSWLDILTCCRTKIWVSSRSFEFSHWPIFNLRFSVTVFSFAWTLHAWCSLPLAWLFNTIFCDSIQILWCSLISNTCSLRFNIKVVEL